MADKMKIVTIAIMALAGGLCVTAVGMVTNSHNASKLAPFMKECRTTLTVPGKEPEVLDLLAKDPPRSIKEIEKRLTAGSFKSLQVTLEDGTVFSIVRTNQP